MTQHRMFAHTWDYTHILLRDATEDEIEKKKKSLNDMKLEQKISQGIHVVNTQ